MFNTAGPKVTQTGEWDPKAALKETLGLETGWQSEKRVLGLGEGGQRELAGGAVHPRRCK